MLIVQRRLLRQATNRRHQLVRLQIVSLVFYRENREKIRRQYKINNRLVPDVQVRSCFWYLFLILIKKIGILTNHPKFSMFLMFYTFLDADVLSPMIMDSD